MASKSLLQTTAVRAPERPVRGVTGAGDASAVSLTIAVCFGLGFGKLQLRRRAIRQRTRQSQRSSIFHGGAGRTGGANLLFIQVSESNGGTDTVTLTRNGSRSTIAGPLPVPADDNGNSL